MSGGPNTGSVGVNYPALLPRPLTRPRSLRAGLPPWGFGPAPVRGRGAEQDDHGGRLTRLQLAVTSTLPQCGGGEARWRHARFVGPVLKGRLTAARTNRRIWPIGTTMRVVRARQKRSETAASRPTAVGQYRVGSSPPFRSDWRPTATTGLPPRTTQVTVPRGHPPMKCQMLPRSSGGSTPGSWASAGWMVFHHPSAVSYSAGLSGNTSCWKSDFFASGWSWRNS